MSLWTSHMICPKGHLVIVPHGVLVHTSSPTPKLPSLASPQSFRTTSPHLTSSNSGRRGRVTQRAPSEVQSDSVFAVESKNLLMPHLSSMSIGVPGLVHESPSPQ